MSGPLNNFDDYEDFDDIHPVQAYGYVYPDGEREFNVAYLMNPSGEIVARALVAVRAKKFVRCYGDDGPILQSHLTAAGYEFVSDMGRYGLRLKKYTTTRGQIIMPYLDGDGRGIKNKGDYWEWNSGSYDYYADSSEARLGYQEDENDGTRECDHCHEYRDEDDLTYSEYHHHDICYCCSEHSYVEAYYQRGEGSTLVRHDEVIYCESDCAYYVNTDRVLRWHDIVEVGCSWYSKDDDDIFCCINGQYVHCDDKDEYIETFNGLYALREEMWVYHSQLRLV